MALPKTAVHTVSFIDEYCNAYKNLFPEVRTFANFKFLHLGIMSEIQRKSLTEIAKVVGLKDSQPLNNFLKNSPWDVAALRSQRLMWIKKLLNNRTFTLVINEIGDRKKGKTTDYVDKQYIGQLAKTANAIVSVNAYGVLDEITFPLIFKVFKPQRSLNINEPYYTKPQLAIAIIQELKQMGFNFETAIVDNIWTRDPELAETMAKFCLSLIVPNDMGKDKCRPKKDNLAESIVPESQDASKSVSDRQLSTLGLESPATDMLTDRTDITPSASSNSSWRVRSDRSELKANPTGEIYNFVNWVEYGFKQVKQELGWGDFRVTNYRAIERWWEIVFSVYWMISLHSDVFNPNAANETQRQILDSAQIASICCLEQEIALHTRLSNLQSIIHL